ncbi:hypothetical protein [Streptomyces antibioticus]|uniref:hypothetical protein n=1 Tax=Streptomyces antibioticus TaxID=1890 RepID=UPI0036DF3D3D
MRPQTEDTDHSSRSVPSGRGRRAAAIFLALCGSAGLLSLVTESGDTEGGLSHDDQVRTQQSLTRSGTRTGAATGPGRSPGCRTDDAGTQKAGSAPADVQWRTVEGAKVPTSASAGPLLASGPVWWCFARTPAGAAMAAQVIPTRLREKEWRAVAERQLLPGPQADFFIAKRSHLRTDAAPAQASYAGFAVSEFSQQRATVRLLIRTGQTGYFSTSVSVAWHEGDWKVVPRADGSLHLPLSSASGSTGFVLWET